MKKRYTIEIAEMLLPEDAVMYEAAARLAAATNTSIDRAKILLDMRTGAISKPLPFEKAAAIATLLTDCGIKIRLVEEQIY